MSRCGKDSAPVPAVRPAPAVALIRRSASTRKTARAARQAAKPCARRFDSAHPIVSVAACQAVCGGRAQGPACAVRSAPCAGSAEAACRRCRRRTPRARPSPVERAARPLAAGGPERHRDPFSHNAREGIRFPPPRGRLARRGACAVVDRGLGSRAADAGDAGAAGDQSGIAHACSGQGSPVARAAVCSARRRR
jgi:hypothetical protein